VTDEPREELLSLRDIERCFGGAIPAVLATASADGVPNVTYISRAHRVDDERIALSNQFMSKTARNLAANPRASLLLMDPVTHDEFRLALVYERTERRGHVFERLRADIEALAALEGMQGVYRLRAADVFRVVEIVSEPRNPSGALPDEVPTARLASAELTGLAEVARCVSRSGDLDALVEGVLDVLDRRLGYAHTTLLLLDESGQRLYTIASHGFDAQGIGAEVVVGDGPIGIVAARCEPMRVGSLTQSVKYSGAIRRRYEDVGVRPDREVPLPTVPGVQSRIVVPAMVAGQLVAVIVAESRRLAQFGETDELVLGAAATLLAAGIEVLRACDAAADMERADRPGVPRRRTESDVPPERPVPAAVDDVATSVRFFSVDASVFLDGEYLIKGVAGRILWSLLRQYATDGRLDYTNRELRLDPTLELPGFKDNLESRLILLKRRLDERDAPVQIERTGRGRFRLDVSAPLALECVEV
jgi:predicted pyridoxine 5'-phosphate oxidase superfamily flavin-nucleotide-binding protein